MSVHDFNLEGLNSTSGGGTFVET